MKKNLLWKVAIILVTLLVFVWGILLGNDPEKSVAAIKQNGGVHGRLAALAPGGQGHPGKHGGWQIAGCRSQLVDRCTAAGEEAGLFKEVCRRIAADDQLGEDGQPSAQPGRLPADGDDPFKIPAEIPDCGVDLGQCDLHTSSLNPKERKGAPPGGTAHKDGKTGYCASVENLSFLEGFEWGNRRSFDCVGRKKRAQLCSG